MRPCREESVDVGTIENLYIEGDNLDALKLLQESYLGKIKMIYYEFYLIMIISSYLRCVKKMRTRLTEQTVDKFFNAPCELTGTFRTKRRILHGGCHARHF